jgi:hypothetical protein
MADVYAVFGTLLALGIAFPGMLTAWKLLFPSIVERAGTRVAKKPWRTFWVGVGLTFIVTLPIGILLALPFGPAKFLGMVLLMLTLAFASLGAAGIPAVMADRLHMGSTVEPSSAAAFVRAAISLELAAAFPFIGWFIVIPIAIFISLGSAFFAVLRWGTRTGPAVDESTLVGEPAPTQV